MRDTLVRIVMSSACGVLFGGDAMAQAVSVPTVDAQKLRQISRPPLANVKVTRINDVLIQGKKRQMFCSVAGNTFRVSMTGNSLMESTGTLTVIRYAVPGGSPQATVTAPYRLAANQSADIDVATPWGCKNGEAARYGIRISATTGGSDGRYWFFSPAAVDFEGFRGDIKDGVPQTAVTKGAIMTDTRGRQSCQEFPRLMVQLKGGSLAGGSGQVRVVAHQTGLATNPSALIPYTVGINASTWIDLASKPDLRLNCVKAIPLYQIALVPSDSAPAPSSGLFSLRPAIIEYTPGTGDENAAPG